MGASGFLLFGQLKIVAHFWDDSSIGLKIAVPRREPGNEEND